MTTNTSKPAIITLHPSGCDYAALIDADTGTVVAVADHELYHGDRPAALAGEYTYDGDQGAIAEMNNLLARTDAPQHITVTTA